MEPVLATFCELPSKCHRIRSKLSDVCLDVNIEQDCSLLVQSIQVWIAWVFDHQKIAATTGGLRRFKARFKEEIAPAGQPADLSEATLGRGP
ncbi:hypothetical protein COCOBI_11-5080 [Coccomyxa sp. Obi]|nr:hypothetical protein COCOBI_11-5080 [Coccomyxa sp. Obi]